jgi:hypothetical protein
MDERTWANIIVKIFDYFRLSTLPTKSQEALWFNEVKHIPNLEVDLIFRAITQECDSLPKNIPKAFKDHRQGGCYNSSIVYNQDDDIRFPVTFMQNSFRILLSRGPIEFKAYCDQVGMPRTDRARVENKHRVCSAHDQDKYKLSEIGTRLNRKTSRPDIMPIRED